MIALSAPVKPKLGEHVSSSDMCSDAPGSSLKSWNNLVLHILGVFDGSQAAHFYCIKYTRQIKSSKLQGNLISWL